MFRAFTRPLWCEEKERVDLQYFPKDRKQVCGERTDPTFYAGDLRLGQFDGIAECLLGKAELVTPSPNVLTHRRAELFFCHFHDLLIIREADKCSMWFQFG